MLPTSRQCPLHVRRFLLFAILTKKCKGCRRVFCIRFFLQKKDNLAKKNAGQCFSNESEATCKNSADLEVKKHLKRYLAFG